MEIKPKLPVGAGEIISRLEDAGYRADIVGGSVRDALLLKNPDDFDITTDALPDDIKRVFSDMPSIDTGIKHGTVTLLSHGKPYEVTTYRIDGEYLDGRHPKEVIFTARIEDDLARRDFTMNAIAYSEKHGLTDPYGGRADIENKIIRAVGDPDLRFSEDALRILRAVRFAAKLGFLIEERTERSLFAKKGLLRQVSGERIFVEWQKLLSGEWAYSVIERYKPVLVEVIPELGLSRLPEKERFVSLSPSLRGLSLFALGGGEEAFVSAMSRLKSDNQTKKRGAAVLRSLRNLKDCTSDECIRLLYIKEPYDVLLDCAALGVATGLLERDISCELGAFKAAGLPSSVAELKINGNDIISLGAKGVKVGKILSELLLGAVTLKVKNEREELLLFASKML